MIPSESRRVVRDDGKESLNTFREQHTETTVGCDGSDRDIGGTLIDAP